MNNLNRIDERNFDSNREVDLMKDRHIEMVELVEVSEPIPDRDDDLTGGDLDVDLYLAEVSGEETIGGSNPTPDQNDVDEIAEAVGVAMSDSEPMRMAAKLEERDEHRWELDPESAGE